jgi:short-subunit dehydrogenase
MFDISSPLFWIGVLVLFRASFLLYRLVLPYVCPRVNLRTAYHTEWALITGANSGLGRHLANMISAQGINIIGVGLEADQLASTKSECESRHVQFISVPTDLTDTTSIETIKSACGNRDIGVVLLNAGYGPFALIRDTSDSQIQKYINLMCTSYALLSREFLSRNRSRGHPSLIYFTASLAADYIVPMNGLYCSAKSYLSLLGKTLSLESAHTNMRITVMHPGCFGSSSFFTSGMQNLIDLLFPGSEKIARAVMASIGRTDHVDCTANSGFFRSLWWIAGELPVYFIGRIVCTIAKRRSKRN